MRKLAILAGFAGASIMALTTGQALAFPGGQSLTAGIAPEIQAVRYRRHHYPPASYGTALYGRRSPNGSPIDSRGWRYFDGSWHNNCFNLDYLDDSAACTGSGRN